MENRTHRLFVCFAAVLLILFVTIGSAFWLRGTVVELREREAENILFYYNEKIILQMQETINEATSLAQTVHAIKSMQTDVSEWFAHAAEPLLKRDEIRMAGLFEGDILTEILPRDKFGSLAGRGLQDFSYIYTMAKVVKELVVEGPVVLEFDPEGRELFLFLQPIIENGSYMGQVVVAVDRDYVLEQLSLEELRAQGYDYELWRVEPQGGSKEIVANSRRDVDFSQAQKAVFYLPTQWTLSIQPADGWISPGLQLSLALLCVLFQLLLLALAYLLYRSIRQKRALRRADYVDRDTGLYNRKGFTAALDGWLCGGSPVTLFYFPIEGYAQAARLIGPVEEETFLSSVPTRMDEYIHSPFLAGRLDAGSYIVALREDLDEEKREDFAKGLSLLLLLQMRLGTEKKFLMARYQYLCCEPGSRAAEKISELIRAYYERVYKESPARSLTEKCRQLIEGTGDVIFDDYTDLEMTELARTFNRYRRQIEHLAYSDPVFAVGNRLKYLRDTAMLISCDKKKCFSLYCVELCSFSQYSELFSADRRDELLHEALRRLSRPFGSYLYHISGGVFLGVSLSGESPSSFASRLQKMFAEPITAGNFSFLQKVRIAACVYPEQGGTPGALLDHLQSALRFARESGQTVALYDSQLDEMLRTEADILRRLREAIRQETLEVWFQPILHLEQNTYSAAEALGRLPDGKGGYFPAGQVIPLAERSGIVGELGDYVLYRACLFMHSRGRALGLKQIGVDISMQQLLAENSAGHLLKLIRSTGIDPRLVTLEIAERILIPYIGQAAQALEKLRQAGVHIALDHLGVGCSRLNDLSSLPVDMIKIDRSLTRQSLISSKQHTLLKFIVEMASIYGWTAVAEGVETPAEQQTIAASGVRLIQGYEEARPMPPEELSRFLTP